MDLRKAILLKKPLQDSSFCSLNNSCASIYESATEDSDSSLMYYSFSNTSIKNSDDSKVVDDIPSELETSVTSEADKENTVIMKDFDENDDWKPQNVEHINMEVDSEAINDKKAENCTENKIGSNDQQTEEESNITEKIEQIIIPQITIEDPNENIVNPFTLTNESENRNSIEVDNVTKRKLLEVKKSASKIPTKTHFYSPVQRKSIDKKSRAIAKPLLRRTIYETRSMTSKKRVTIIPPPVPPKVSASKSVTHKCSIPGCLREFRTPKLLQDHLESHSNISSTPSTSSFKCKWCDKTFLLNIALTNHLLDKCSKITFAEKRKLLAEQDKTNQAIGNNKRKSIFVAPAPVPRKRSPKRQTINKSGIIITPKKTLKCSCGKIFTNVLEFANHAVSHKYEEALNNREAQN